MLINHHPLLMALGACAIHACSVVVMAQNSNPQPATSDTPPMITRYPAPTNISSVPITNKNKGWSIYSWGRMPVGFAYDALDSAGNVYLRYDWGSLEPNAQGEFDWTIIDEHLEAVAKLGKRLGFRIMALNPHSPLEYTFPKWVVDGHEDQFYKATINLEGRMVDKWFPHDPNTSPRWKEACQHLAKALGERYNNHPGIAFIEVGTIGDWGEQISNYAPTNQMLTQEAWREHLSWYREAFPNKQLLSVCGGQHGMQYEWADQQKFGRRTDGFCAPPVKEDNTFGTYQDGQIIKPSFEARVPSFMEFPPSVDYLARDREFWWGTFWKGILDYGKPTYVGYNWGNRLANRLAERYPFRLIESGNRIGYHLVLERISHPASMLLGGKAELTLELRNDGCRYPDDPIHVAIARFDQKQNLLDKVWCEGVDLQTNMHPWVSYEQFDTYSGRIVLEQPKTHRASVEIEFPISDTAHELAIGFFSDRSLTQPDIRVGIHGRNENGWYPLEQFGDTPPTNAFPSLHSLSLRKSVMVADTAEGQTGFVTDGHAETFWQSPAGAGQWVMIDLGTIQPIDMVMLDWGATFPKGYKIEASANGQNWTSLLRTDNNQGGYVYHNLGHNLLRYLRLVSLTDEPIALHEIELLGSTPVQRRFRRR